jgi:threonine/homoserine/homoserine lactone efflux protein
MIPLANLVTFVLVAIPILIAPGPSVLFIIGRSLALGRKGGLLSVLGNGIGAFVVVLAVSLGVGSIIAQSAVLFTVVKVVGAGYLVYLGIQAIRHRNDGAGSSETPSPRSTWRLLLDSAIVGVSNPKTIVFFIAVLPQFVDYASGAVQLQMLTLGTVFVVLALIPDTAWALTAGVAREWFARSPRRRAGLAASGGVAMIGLGVGSLFVGNSKN